MTIVVDGNALSREVMQKNHRLVKRLEQKNRRASLAIFAFSDDPASQRFLQKKQEAGAALGIAVSLFSSSIKKLPEAVQFVKDTLESEKPDGAIIQLPLPRSLRHQDLLDAVDPARDVDMLSSTALGRLVAGDVLFSSPVIAAVDLVLKKHKITLRGKQVVVVGAGLLVGKPLSLYCMNQQATVTVINEFTPKLETYTTRADVLIAGAGKPHLITRRLVKKGALIFDIGFTIQKKKIYGDVDFASVWKKTALITPVPGGIGALTVAFLFHNTLQAAVRLSSGSA